MRAAAATISTIKIKVKNIKKNVAERAKGGETTSTTAL